MGTTDEVVGRGLVLEDETHGPQLCLGAILTSNPPRGGGPDLLGWDWSTVQGPVERYPTARLGYFRVVGTFADGALTLTRTPVADPPLSGEEAAARQDAEDRWLASWPTPVGWDDPEARRRAERRLWDVPGVVMVEGFDDGPVVVEVALDDGTLQRRLDEEYPGGLVAVRSALRPLRSEEEMS